MRQNMLARCRSCRMRQPPSSIRGTSYRRRDRLLPEARAPKGGFFLLMRLAEAGRCDDRIHRLAAPHGKSPVIAIRERCCEGPRPAAMVASDPLRRHTFFARSAMGGAFR